MTKPECPKSRWRSNSIGLRFVPWSLDIPSSLVGHWRCSRHWLSCLLLAACCLLASGSAHAHALSVECKLKGDTVVVEAFFSDNKPAPNAKVTVRDSHGNELATGRTDDEGRWTFPAPAAGKYEVTCDAGEGHRRPVIVTIPTVAALKPITPTPEEIVVTGGPTREELTRNGVEVAIA